MVSIIQQQKAEYSFHPTICHCCGAAVQLINKSQIIRSASDEDLVYSCANDTCNAYVGCRKGTRTAIGSLAQAETRQARREAHAAMRQLLASGRMSERAAYEWMQYLLNLPYNRRGISWLRLGECRKLINEIHLYLTNARAESAQKGIANLRALLSQHKQPGVPPESHCVDTDALSQSLSRFKLHLGQRSQSCL